MANFSIIAKLGMDSSKFKSGMSRVGSGARKLGGMIGGLLKAGFLAAGAAAVAFTVKAIKAFSSFEKKMAEVKTLLPNMSEEAFGKLEKDIRKLAVTMGVDITDAVDGLYSALSAGISPENAITFLADATDLAKAGVTDLDTAVGALTTVINGYGLEADDANAISKLLFATVGAGKVELKDLAPHIGKVTAVAANLGVTFEEVSAMTAMLGSKLGEGQLPTAMSKLKVMFSEMLKSGTKVNDVFMELQGVNIGDFLAGGGTMEEVLNKLQEHAIATGGSMMDMFSSIEAGEGAMNLMGEGADSLGAQLENVRGFTEGFGKAVDTMGGTTDDAWSRLKSAGTEVLLKFGEALDPLIKRVLPMFMGYMEAWPAILGSTEGGVNLLSLALEAVAFYIEMMITASLSGANMLGHFADSCQYLITVGKILWKTLKNMGETAFAPLLANVELTMTAFRSLATVMENPTDVQAVQKAFRALNTAWEKQKTTFKDFGKGFKEEFKKHRKELNEAEKTFLEAKKKRLQIQEDIWQKKGMFEFLGGANMAANEMQRAAGGARDLDRNLRNTKGAIQKAAANIDDKLIKALARGAREAAPLVAAMKKIQDAAKAAADFWGQAVKDVKEVAKGKVPELKIVRPKGQAGGVAGVGFQMGAEQKKRFGGDLAAGQMAALDPKQQQEVQEAWERNKNAGRMLLAMFQLEQRARDMTVEGLKKLDAQVLAFEKSAEAAAVSLQHLDPEMQAWLKWLKLRRDIADENIRLQFKNNVALQKLGRANAALADSAGQLHDELMKDVKDQDPEKIAQWRKQFGDLGVAVKEAKEAVREEARRQGVKEDPAALKEFKEADELIARVDAVKKTAEDSLEDILVELKEMKANDINRNMELGNIALNTIWIHDQLTVLESIDNKMSGLIDAVNQMEVKEGGVAPIRKGGASELAQEETQQQVLETVSGFFINQ